MAGTDTSVAFVGAGGMARTHMDAIDGIGMGDIVAVCDVEETVAREVGERRCARAYTDYEEMYETEALDAVFVTVPGFARGEIGVAALERGLDLFVEKPVALDMETARRIEAAAEEAGAVTQVGYNYRYCDITDRAVELVGDSTLAAIDGHWLWGNPGRDGWRSEKATSGGIIPELSTHVYDLARYFGGEVDQVSAAGGHRIEEGVDYQDTVTGVMHHETDVVSHVTTTIASPDRKVGLRLIGEGFRLDLAYRDNTLEGYVDGNEIAYLGDGDAGDASAREVRAFLDAVRTRDESELRSPLSDGVTSLAVNLAVDRAAVEGAGIDPREIG